MFCCKLNIIAVSYTHLNNIQFTIEHEEDNKINFLDLTIIKKGNKFQYKIYRKPTTTDLTINAESYHPYSQKLAAFHSFINRLINIPLEADDFEDELNTIKYIATRNGFSSTLIDTLLKKHLKDKHNNKNKLKINRNTNIVKYISAEYTNIDVYKRQVQGSHQKQA